MTSGLVIFLLNNQKYALYLSAVKEVLPAMEITPLPQATDIILGLINLRGEIIPVFNTRKRFQLPERPLDVNDHLIVATAGKRMVALLVDTTEKLIPSESLSISEVPHIHSRLDFVRGVCKLDDDLILIHDLETFLSPEEDTRLTEALSAVTPHP